MLLNYIKEFLENETLYKTIFNNLKKTRFSYLEIKQTSKNFIKILIDYLDSESNKNILARGSYNFFKDLDEKDINFSNIIISFNIFYELFLENYYNKLSNKDILILSKSINHFITYITISYEERFKLFYEKIINSISSGVLILDNKLNILKTNKKFFEIIGTDEFEIRGTNLKDLLKDREGIPIDKLKEICLKNKTLKETELLIKRNNNRKYHRTIYADVLYNENNNQEGFIVYIKDTDYLQYLKETFSKYLSSQVAEKILSEKDINLKGERRKLAVMFIDIRDFTKFSEINPPEYVLETLNNYFNLIIDIIFEYGGTLDKFIGDGVMVIFGAPIEYNDNIERCLDCAIKIQKEVKKLNQFKIGIGINYGDVIVGNIGSKDKRVEYTAIGDTVNTAQRLESITPKDKIYITGNLLPVIKNNRNYQVSFIKNAKFKGKTKLVEVYELIF